MSLYFCPSSPTTPSTNPSGNIENTFPASRHVTHIPPRQSIRDLAPRSAAFPQFSVLPYPSLGLPLRLASFSSWINITHQRLAPKRQSFAWMSSSPLENNNAELKDRMGGILKSLAQKIFLGMFVFLIFDIPESLVSCSILWTPPSGFLDLGVFHTSFLRSPPPWLRRQRSAAHFSPLGSSNSTGAVNLNLFPCKQPLVLFKPSSRGKDPGRSPFQPTMCALLGLFSLASGSSSALFLFIAISV
nr:hypothetical protein CFP56_56473 [Quercus suber]